MAEHGAKNIVLASRSGKTDRAMALIKQFSPLGVTVEVCKADVAIEADVHRLIAECGKKMPPIGGVIHGAYVNKVCNP